MKIAITGASGPHRLGAGAVPDHRRPRGSAARPAGAGRPRRGRLGSRPRHGRSRRARRASTRSSTSPARASPRGRWTDAQARRSCAEPASGRRAAWPRRSPSLPRSRRVLVSPRRSATTATAATTGSTRRARPARDFLGRGLPSEWERGRAASGGRGHPRREPAHRHRRSSPTGGALGKMLAALQGRRRRRRRPGHAVHELDRDRRPASARSSTLLVTERPRGAGERGRARARHERASSRKTLGARARTPGDRAGAGLRAAPAVRRDGRRALLVEHARAARTAAGHRLPLPLPRARIGAAPPARAPAAVTPARRRRPDAIG